MSCGGLLTGTGAIDSCSGSLPSLSLFLALQAWPALCGRLCECVPSVSCTDLSSQWMIAVVGKATYETRLICGLGLGLL